MWFKGSKSISVWLWPPCTHMKESHSKEIHTLQSKKFTLQALHGHLHTLKHGHISRDHCADFFQSDLICTVLGFRYSLNIDRNWLFIACAQIELYNKWVISGPPPLLSAPCCVKASTSKVKTCGGDTCKHWNSFIYSFSWLGSLPPHMMSLAQVFSVYSSV